MTQLRYEHVLGLEDRYNLTIAAESSIEKHPSRDSLYSSTASKYRIYLVDLIPDPMYKKVSGTRAP